MNPFLVHLIYGTVTSSQGNVVANAQLAVTTSVTTKIYNTNADGIYMLNLADIGYVAGETITINVTEQFNNELKSHKYTVIGSFSEENITLGLRIAVERISDLQQQNVLHSVGKSPITPDNPLSIFDKGDPLAGYVLAGGDDNNRLYGYVNKGGAWYIQKFDSSNDTYKYVRGSSNFISSWDGRTGLTYELPNEVF